MQVFGRQAQILGKGAVMALDPEGGSIGAVSLVSPSTGLALAADYVDLTYNPFSSEMLRTRLDLADELMPRNAAKGVEASHHLEIRVADSGAKNTYQGIVGPRIRSRDIRAKSEIPVFEP